MSEKKKQQLGMSPGAASNRLIKDILWDFINKLGMVECHHCGEPMSRDTFSIEHKVPWLDSPDPVGLYFDLDNIGFSHLSCNCRESQRGKYKTDEERKEAIRESNRKSWTAEKRRAYYLKSGK